MAIFDNFDNEFSNKFEKIFKIEVFFVDMFFYRMIVFQFHTISFWFNSSLKIVKLVPLQIT
jgi:hypothetical protein